MKNKSRNCRQSKKEWPRMTTDRQRTVMLCQRPHRRVLVHRRQRDNDIAKRRREEGALRLVLGTLHDDGAEREQRRRRADSEGRGGGRGRGRGSGRLHRVNFNVLETTELLPSTGSTAVLYCNEYRGKQLSGTQLFGRRNFFAINAL